MNVDKAVEQLSAVVGEEAKDEVESNEEDEEELPPLEKRTDILYCGVCSIPPEYCIFNPPDLYADCLRWQAKCHTELLPEGASVDDMLAKLNLHNSGSGGKINSSGDGRAGVNAAAGEGESTGEGEEDDGNGREEDECGKKKKGGPKGIKKKETTSGGKVLIMRMSRNKRKSITVVTGLDSYPDLKLKDVAKALGKAFASGASVSDTGSGGKEIVIQGDVIDSLAIMLEEKYKVPATNIMIKS
ncbi:rna binding protein [Nannochloropsis gaditana CCMP526]|uniref:rna binding protein n=1 Tax=Nannochloropsis gaditana (strain CCMP526) TaxID=1093141 RepID=UPI00029F5016|nr:rna binding protein [Nannochloropsis gaditana CCMP526]EKU21386.1 rna binding protein [Nannochloropsis gaditana CCMP526]|eukprot:XP_005854975.1 rna binding protein [Nannochloropsis gaditana CCMP526]